MTTPGRTALSDAAWSPQPNFSASWTSMEGAVSRFSAKWGRRSTLPATHGYPGKTSALS